MQWSAIGNWQQLVEKIIEGDPLITTQGVTEELIVDHSTVIWCLTQIGKVKKLDKWMPHEPTENQKNHHFEVSSFILRNNKPFLNQIVMCDKKWILHDNQWWPNQWLDWEETPKHFPKQTCTKKIHGHCLVIHYSLVKALNLRSMLSKSMWSTGHCNAGSQYMGQHSGPSSSQHPTTRCPTLQKLNELGYKVLPHLPCSPDLLPTDYHFFEHLENFLQGKCFHNQQESENAFQEFVESQSTDFYATGINKHFLLAKMHWL